MNVRNVLIAGAVVISITGLLLFGRFFFADPAGAPVPHSYEGRECWRSGAILTCKASGPFDDVFVEHGGSWTVARDCRDVSPTLTRCRLPYPLEIDRGGDWLVLRRLGDG